MDKPCDPNEDPGYDMYQITYSDCVTASPAAPAQDTTAKDDEIKALKAQMLAQCNEARASLHDCNKACPGEDPKDFEIYHLKCQMSMNQDSCKEDRLKYRDCDKSCAGETPKQTQIAKLECQYAALKDQKAKQDQFSDQFSDSRPEYTIILI